MTFPLVPSHNLKDTPIKSTRSPLSIPKLIPVPDSVLFNTLEWDLLHNPPAIHRSPMGGINGGMSEMMILVWIIAVHNGAAYEWIQNS